MIGKGLVARMAQIELRQRRRQLLAHGVCMAGVLAWRLFAGPHEMQTAFVAAICLALPASFVAAQVGARLDGTLEFLTALPTPPSHLLASRLIVLAAASAPAAVYAAALLVFYVGPLPAWAIALVALATFVALFSFSSAGLLAVLLIDLEKLVAYGPIAGLAPLLLLVLLPDSAANALSELGRRLLESPALLAVAGCALLAGSAFAGWAGWRVAERALGRYQAAPVKAGGRVERILKRVQSR